IRNHLLPRQDCSTFPVFRVPHPVYPDEGRERFLRRVGFFEPLLSSFDFGASPLLCSRIHRRLPSRARKLFPAKRSSMDASSTFAATRSSSPEESAPRAMSWFTTAPSSFFPFS